MSPELTLLIVNGVLMAYAYLWAYPSLPEKTLRAIMVRDTAISVAALGIAAGLYWGTGVRFSVVLFETNWFWFSIITLFAMETPLFFWFARKYGINFDNFD